MLTARESLSVAPEACEEEGGSTWHEVQQALSGGVPPWASIFLVHRWTMPQAGMWTTMVAVHARLPGTITDSVGWASARRGEVQEINAKRAPCVPSTASAPDTVLALGHNAGVRRMRVGPAALVFHWLPGYSETRPRSENMCYTEYHALSGPVFLGLALHQSLVPSAGRPPRRRLTSASLDDAHCSREPVGGS